MLPVTPTATSGFPRLVRGGYNEVAVMAGPVAFAKRKKSVFKGPMLNTSKRDSMGSMSSKQRGGGGIIEEEEEGDDEEILDYDEEIMVDDDKYEDDLVMRRAASH
jgi:hypothetical protein